MNSLTYPKFQAFDDNGNFLDGGKLSVYARGTSTESTTYSDALLATPTTNPIVLNTRGEAQIFGNGIYKFVLTDADDNLIWEQDDISVYNNLKTVTPEMFGAKGDGVTDDGAAIQAADSYAAGSGLTAPIGKVIFDFKDYYIETQVSKSPYTFWDGAGCFTWSAGGKGTKLINGTDTAMISISNNVGYIYAGYSGRITNMYLWNDLSLHPAATAITMQLIRQNIFENLMIMNFYIGMYLNAVGEIYTDKVFINCVFSMKSLNGADNIYHRTFLGGDFGTNNFGYYGQGDGNITFTDCRFQMCAGGWGGLFIGSWGLQFSNCIADGSELGGLWFANCFDVSCTNLRGYNNGAVGGFIAAVTINADSQNIDSIDTTEDTISFATDTNFFTLSPVQLTTTDTLPTGLTTGRDYWLYRVSGYDTYLICDTVADCRNGTGIDLTDSGVGTHTVVAVSRNLNFTGGCLYDENYPQAAACIQYFGFNINQDSGIISEVTITGVDMSRTYGAVNLVAGISGLSFSNCPGLEPWELANNAAALAAGLSIGAVYRITGSDAMGVVHS